LASFVRAAAARALYRDALRATRDLTDARTRIDARSELSRNFRLARGSDAHDARAQSHALSDGRRRVKELKEMIAMVR